MSAGDVFAAIKFLANHVVEEFNFQYDISYKIKKLIRELEWTQAFLEDAEEKQRGMSFMRKWIADVRDTSYSLEDEIEKYIFVVEKRRRHNWVFRYASVFNFLVKRHQIGTSIDRLQEEIKDISESRSRYGIDILGETTRRNELGNDLGQQRRAKALEEESSFVGLDNDLNCLMTDLLDADKQSRCCISVVGMGGLGKTAIARKVYADVRRNFNCSAFVYISQEFNIKDVLEKIRRGITGTERKKDDVMKDEAELRREIITFLKGKRYLVVLDDVWSEQLWLKLGSVFPDDNNGSRLLLTTRIKDVAKYVDPQSSLHTLRLLDEHESWELFRQKTRLVPGEDPEDLFKLGREITQKCGGLPLAIIVLGGLLSRKPKQVESWKGVLNRISSELKESPERCKDILAMSYYDLPIQMKPCFLYFALFPEDSDIPAKRLIHFLVAENLVEAGQNEKLEDAAKRYLEELINRSLIQVVEREHSGELEVYRIHDLLRDLAIEEARKDNFLHTCVSKAAKVPVNNVRRLSIQSEVPQEIENFELYTNRLRSLFLRSPISLSKVKELIPKMHLLRVLVITILRGTSVSKNRLADSKDTLVLPKEINQLIHLRYLRIQFSYKLDDSERLSPIYSKEKDCFKFLNPYLSKLSPTPRNLKYLQTLDFGNYVVNMSHSIWSLYQLRHLYGRHLSIVGDAGDERIDRLENLQTLHLKAGNWINGGFEKLSNLRDLRISGSLGRYHKVISKALLKNLFELRVLEFKVDYSCLFPQLPSLSHSQYLTRMYLWGPMTHPPAEFPPNLVQLDLIKAHFEISNDLLVTLQNLKELKYLTLYQGVSHRNEIHFLSEGFSKLEELKLTLCGQTLNIKEGALRRLKYLRILSNKLEHIPAGLKFMGSLRELRIDEVSSELFDRLQSGGEDWQQIKHVTSIEVSCGSDSLHKDSKGNPNVTPILMNQHRNKNREINKKNRN